MPKSPIFRQLTKELNRLKKQFLPRKFSETNEFYDNPADELERVKQIIQELEKVDQLITNLLK
ncbi:MAG: hypothetical protein ACKO8M_12380 [Microcystis panniformis]